MGWGANTLKSWKVGHGFEKVENPCIRATPISQIMTEQCTKNILFPSIAIPSTLAELIEEELYFQIN